MAFLNFSKNNNLIANSTKVPEAKETESEATFSKALAEKDFETIIAFLDNEYELTQKQADKVGEAAANLLTKKIGSVGKNLYDQNGTVHYFSPFEFTKINTEEFLMLYIAFNYSFSDSYITNYFFGNANLIKKLELLALHTFEASELKHSYQSIYSMEDAVDLLSSILKSRIEDSIQSYEKDIKNGSKTELSDYQQSTVDSYKKDLISLKNKSHPFYKHLQYSQEEKSSFVPVITSDSKFKTSTSLSPEKRKNRTTLNNNSHDIYFHDTYTNIYMFRDTTKMEEIHYVQKDDFNSLSSSELSAFINNLLVRTMSKDDNINKMIDATLQFDCPALFTYLNNLSYQMTTMESFKPTVAQLEKQNENLLKASKEYAKYHAPLYLYFQKVNKIIYEDYLTTDPIAISKKLNRKDVLQKSISKMKEEKFRKKITTSNTEQLIEDSLLQPSTKRMMKDAISISNEFKEFPNLGENERHFLSRTDNSLLNILELQFAFSTNNPSELTEYQKSASEQVQLLLKTIHDIRDGYKATLLQGINEQVSDLLEHKHVKTQVLKA